MYSSDNHNYSLVNGQLKFELPDGSMIDGNKLPKYFNKNSDGANKLMQLNETSYKSGGKSQMPITIRAVVGKGWGQGPQHSKSLHSWFSHLPGISVVYPSSPSEAKGCFMTSIFSNFPTIIFESRSLHATEEKVPEGNYFVDI